MFLRSLRTCCCGLGLLAVGGAWAQCGTPIATFPYSEGFETAAAWTSGGTNNDWAWGTPAHPFINTAGGGTRAWCVGGLTGASYNDDERSWLESPCFDLSALDHPWISFKIAWRLETQYDGLVLQYSLDGGTTYANVGAFGDAEDCLNANWYNTSDVLNLSGASPRHGWSGGNTGSCLAGGSGGWITAKHCLTELAHEPSVRFRFYFGAGHQCNDYDGAAIDDILIQDAPLGTASFTYTCSGNTLQFYGQTTGCPDAFQWDFGEPSSGNANTATGQIAAHTFAGPGTYTVTHTQVSGCAGTAVSTSSVTIMQATLSAQDALCGLGSGSALVQTNVASPSYLWSPGGQTTASINGLDAGSYTVTVSAPGACPFTGVIAVVQGGTGLTAQQQVTDPSCAGLADGSASVQVSGGTPAYTYAWSPSGGDQATATDLPAGAYTCTITDAAGCITARSMTLTAPSPVVVEAPASVNTCAGTPVTLTATATGGTPDYAFTWSPEGPVVAPSGNSAYTVVATDQQGCTSAPAQVAVVVGAALVPAIAATDTTGCTPLCSAFSAGDAVPGLSYSWDFGDGTFGNGAAVTHCYTVPGVFTVHLTVSDATGCSGTLTAPDLVEAWPVPEAQFLASASTITTEHPVVRFTDTSTDATERLWSFGDAGGSSSMEAEPSFAFPGYGCYTVSLLVGSANGCTDLAQQEICVEDPYAVYAPNAFTPNGDGINDAFIVRSSVREPTDYRLVVFDRWGRERFSSTTPFQPWDGDGGPEGVYIWKLWLRDTDSKLHELTGHVTLVR